MYNDIINKINIDTTKYIVNGYFVYKIREDGIYKKKGGLNDFVNYSIFRQDWRDRVIAKNGKICSFCHKEITAEKGDLFVKFKGGMQKYLIAKGITS